MREKNSVGIFAKSLSSYLPTYSRVHISSDKANFQDIEGTNHSAEINATSHEIHVMLIETRSCQKFTSR